MIYFLIFIILVLCIVLSLVLSRFSKLFQNYQYLLTYFETCIDDFDREFWEV